ncbi:MAG TPA: M1 family metallopeptidase [bacterium]|nr:M1 family metallopeptidase [bacterium]
MRKMMLHRSGSSRRARKRKLKWLLVLGILALLIHPGDLSAADYWQQYVRYTMDVSLDAEQKVLTGDETVVYYNHSPDTLENIYFHLYPNAFRSDSTLKSIQGKTWYQEPPSPPHRSWITIEEFTATLGGKSSDAFSVDETILYGPLPGSLLPGDSLEVRLRFAHHIREHYGRAGYQHNQFDFAQWYPKVVVYDERGWDNEIWPNIGEFYGEFADFQVTITVPDSFIVAATGTVVDGNPGWEEVTVEEEADYEEWYQEYLSRKETRFRSGNRRSVTFAAKNVHDFAWNTSPDFVYEHGTHENVDVHVLYQASRGRSWHNQVVQHATRTLDWLEKKFGEYQYPQVTVVHGLLGGGMEYPMLVMDGNPSEGLAVHEIGHIYFYGILANDEMAEAWLDEGFTTFQTLRYLEYHYGKEGRSMQELNEEYPGLRARFPRVSEYEDDQEAVIEMQLSGEDEPMAQPADEFGSYDAYRYNVYTKASLMLDMLEFVMGEQAFWSGMRDYYDTWKLKHVNEDRFREVMNRHSTDDLDWFFDQWLHSTGFADYALDGYEVEPRPEGGYRVTVSITRKGPFIMPVDVELRFYDGGTLRTRWFEHTDQGSVTFETGSKVAKVVLDPDNRILDVDRTNNSSGIPEHEFLPEYPEINYTPRDAYLVEWWPSFWYNAIDGARLGFHIGRQYSGDRKQFRAKLWYGAKSTKIDYDIRYSDVLYRLLPDFRYSIRIAHIEGRQWNQLGITKSWSRAYRLLPMHRISLGVRNIELTDARYPVELWDPGVNNQLYVTYRSDFRAIRWRSFFAAAATESHPLLASDFDYQKLTFEWQIRTTQSTPEVRFRLFSGWTYPSDPLPEQETYSIANGGQYAYFNQYYARSRGSFFGRTNAYDYLWLPGDGSVRAFQNSDVPGATRLIAGNLELRFPLDRAGVNARPAFYLFSDYAYAELPEGENTSAQPVSEQYLTLDLTLGDLGLGFSFRGTFFQMPYLIRADVPLWVNDTEYLSGRDNRFGTRILLSFHTLF